MKKVLSVILAAVLIVSVFFVPNFGSAQYPPPEATPTPGFEPLPDIPEEVLEPNEFCMRLPPEDNVCGWGLFTVDGGLTRWYVTKDGVIDVEPPHAFCIIWSDLYGRSRDTCLELRIHSYHPGRGVNGSGRNLYVTDSWLVCGGGFIYYLVMANIYGEMINGEIRQPNYYLMDCWFLPFQKKAQITSWNI